MIGVKLLNKVLFPLLSVQVVLLSNLFQYCYLQISQAVTWGRKMGSGGIVRFVSDIAPVISKAISQPSLCLSNVSLSAWAFLAFNHVYYVVAHACCFAINFPCLIFIYLDISPLFYIGASSTVFATFWHSLDFSYWSLSGWWIGRVENINLSYSFYAFNFLDFLGNVQYEKHFVFWIFFRFVWWNLNFKKISNMSTFESAPKLLKFGMHLVHRILRPMVKRWD